MWNHAVRQLISYAEEKKLIAPEDRVYTVNRLLEALGRDAYDDPGDQSMRPLCEILRELTDDAVARGVIGDGIVSRDLFDTKLMGLLTPRPSEVIPSFRRRFERDPAEATDWFYRFCGDCNYIRRDRIARDLKWQYASPYGTLDITINLSKPEKDPKAIAEAGKRKPTGYPRCSLCRENEGYAGHLAAPARQNHRCIPLTLNGGAWFFQYSPYVYYNEHCIVFRSEHTPMAITRDTFACLLDFVRQFPHYFIGSNADLPIVGGSILSHDHFQGGRYEFAMARAPISETVVFRGFEESTAGIVNWPMSVIRIRGGNPERLSELAGRILNFWRGYSDPSAFVFAETDGEKHNTVTPIARRRDGLYELDLVLRCNIMTEEHPLGVFHPHAALHHIKKENIGLIEVMGLAVLPARLKAEMQALADAMAGGADRETLCRDPLTEKHADWAASILKARPDFDRDSAEEILREEIGAVFTRVLEDAGVFKRTESGQAAFRRFLDAAGRAD